MVEAAIAAGWVKSLIGWWGRIRTRREDWNLSQHIQGPRREIFEGLRQIRDAICTTALPNLSQISRLHKLREDSAIVFDERVAAYIDEWIAHAAALNAARDVLSNPAASDEQREKYIVADHAALTFFSRQYVDLARKFKPYIGSK